MRCYRVHLLVFERLLRLLPFEKREPHLHGLCTTRFWNDITYTDILTTYQSHILPTYQRLLNSNILKFSSLVKIQNWQLKSITFSVINPQIVYNIIASPIKSFILNLQFFLLKSCKNGVHIIGTHFTNLRCYKTNYPKFIVENIGPIALDLHNQRTTLEDFKFKVEIYVEWICEATTSHNDVITLIITHDAFNITSKIPYNRTI